MEWPSATKLGYKFKGWLDEGGNPITGDTQVINSAPIQNLYALWESNVYKVILNNGSATTSGSEYVWEKYGVGIYKDYIYQNGNYECQNEMTTNANPITLPTKKGYTFGGYYTGENGAGIQLINENGYITDDFTTTKYTSDGVIYANWIPQKYIVTLNEGSGSIVNDQTEVTYGSKYGTLPEPTREGYEFKGWYTAEGDKVESETIVEKAYNHELYAQWTPNKYIVDLNVFVEGIGTEAYGVDGVFVDITMNGITSLQVRDYWTGENEMTMTEHGSEFTMKNIVVGMNYKYLGTITVFEGKGVDRKRTDYEIGQEDEFELIITDETEIRINVGIPEPDAEYIETNKDYRYTTDLGDYKVLSKTPETGGITAKGKESMVINITFSFDESNTDYLQYLLGAQESSGYELYITRNNIVFGIWNESEGKYSNVTIEDVDEFKNSIINATAIYDGTNMKLYIREEGKENYESAENEIQLTLNQLDTVPTLLGENPIPSKGYETSNKYISTSEWSKSQASHFTGKIYNARIWFNKIFNEEQRNYIYNKGIGEARDLIN